MTMFRSKEVKLDEPHQMLTFLEMSYTYGAPGSNAGAFPLYCVDFTASLTHAAQPVPQELMNQWFAVEV